MNRNRIVVTVGPTISREEVLLRLPQAEVRGPVAADEVLRWGLQSGDSLLIIDGLFLQARAVRHKELLAVLDRGVRLFGSSGMGALRAAELEAFGMRGAGKVFRDYRDGVLVGDDEVAVTHADAEAGYRPLGWALVDLRHAAAVAVRCGVVDPGSADTIVRAAKALPFALRDTPTVIEAARAQGCHGAALAAFGAFCRQRKPSVMRTDALAALRMVAADARRAGGERLPCPTGHLRYRGRPAELSVTTYLRYWAPSDGAADQAGNAPALCCTASDPVPPGGLRDDEVINAFALTCAGFPDLLRSVAAECLLLDTLGVPVGAGLRDQRRLLSTMVELDDPAALCLPWKPLCRALSSRLTALNLPVSALSAAGGDRNCSHATSALLRSHEKTLPWQEAGPLLATRVWRCDPRVDWRSPLMQRLRISPDFVRICAAVARGQHAPLPAPDPGELREGCRQVLMAWGAHDSADIPPSLAAHGFLGLGELVRAVHAGWSYLHGNTTLRS
ncbi:TfuA-like protein (plasmid) [Streptomyces sp. CA-142005]|uniref:TfuA-like protein n=1 Tax=Streptomyces sp. CA-142005 TaxID=3240052 RepID=UPI003D8D4EE0